jgi:RHS repeat-associated protein
MNFLFFTNIRVVKSQKQVAGVTKDYCQGIEYKDGVTLMRFRAKYWLKDHLGNTRLAFADENHNGTIEVWDDPSTPENEAEIVQENHYYPFGMNHEGPWYGTIGPRNGYQYNGKELNEELELGWNDFGARWYDASIGRFLCVDPIADQFPWVTPYNYAENEPVGSIDLWGLQRLKVDFVYRTKTASEFNRNRATLGVSIRHPRAASTIGAFESGSKNISSVSARIARHASADGENLSKGIGSESNALRHAIWSATINQKFGSDIAEELTNAHEGIGFGSIVSMDMAVPFVGDMSLADDLVDFLNNEIGRSITSEGGDLSTKEIAEKSLEVFYMEGLYTASQNADGNVVIKQTKITQEQYDNALKIIRALNENGFSKEEQVTHGNKKN